MLVELHSFVVLLLRIGKKLALDILACRGSQDGFCAQALVDMQRHWIDGEGFRLLFACPFEPGGTVFQGVGEDFDFVVGKSVLRLFEEFGELVGCPGFVESEDGRQVGVVSVLLLGLFADPPVGGDAGGRVVSSSGVVVSVVLDFGGLGGAVVLWHRCFSVSVFWGFPRVRGCY